MNREDIIRMAREAGAVFPADGSYHRFESEENLEHFAALVAKHTLANIDPSSFMTWQEGYEVGKQTEREACAEVCKKHADVYEKLEQNPTAQSAWAACIDNRDAIRARGQA
jgi:hypothetical protein